MTELAAQVTSSEAYEEFPVFLDAAEGDVFGIVTFPRMPRDRTAVIVLASGGTPLTTNRNRVSVRMCRGVASLGYTAFRMDYHGTGESSGTVDSLHLGRPFVGDVLAAVAYLKGLGIERFVLLGSCFGSRTALATGGRIDGVETVIALATPLRDFAMGETPQPERGDASEPGALRPRVLPTADHQGLLRSANPSHLSATRPGEAPPCLGARRAGASVVDPSPGATNAIGPRFEEALRALVDRKVPILFVYGEDEDYYEEFREASDGDLAELRARAGPLYPGRDGPRTCPRTHDGRGPGCGRRPDPRVGPGTWHAGRTGRDQSAGDEPT